MADYSLPHHDPRFTGANRRDQPPRGPSEKDRGRTTLFGREPNAGCGKPSKPDVLVTPCAPEMSKSHSKISCIALNQKPTDVTAFVRRLQQPSELPPPHQICICSYISNTQDKSFCFFRDSKPSPYVFRDEVPATAGTWRPTDRPAIAMATDRAAGDIVQH